MGNGRLAYARLTVVGSILLVGSILFLTGCSGRSFSSERVPANFVVRNIYVKGAIGWIGGSGGVLYTSDSGVNWIRTFRGDVSGAFVISPVQAWAYGTSGLEVTSTGGYRWRKLSNMSFDSVEFVDRRTGYALIQRPGNALGLYITHDGGAKWKTTSSTDLSSVCFVNSQSGWGIAYNQNRILYTDNSGVSWRSELYLGQIESQPGNIQCSERFGWAMLYGGAGMEQMSYSVLRETTSRWRVVAIHSTPGGGRAPTMGARAAKAPDMVPRAFQSVTALSTVILGYSGNSLVVAYTEDGGRAWSASSIPTYFAGSPAGAGMYVEGANRYFVVVSKKPGDVILCWTGDRGRHWRTEALSSGTGHSWATEQALR